MKAWILVLVLLAGCAAPAEDPIGTPDAPMDTPDNTATTPQDLTLSLDPVPVTKDATMTVTGNTSGPAVLSLRLVDNTTHELGSLDVDGAWTQTIEVPFGQSTLVATADDGHGAATARIDLVRLAKGTLSLRFNGYPGQTDSDDEVWLDVDAHPSAPAYAAEGAEHPGFANVHDLMAQWEADTGHVVETTYNAGFDGFSVDRIDGAGNPVTASAPPWWCFTVDGDGATLGITLEPFHDGMVVVWDLGTCT